MRRNLTRTLALGGVMAACGLTLAQEVLVEHQGDGKGLYPISGGVDWDGDEVPDFLVEGEDRESVVVVSGATGETIRTYVSPGGTLLASVFAPDMTGDGEPDILVGLNRGTRSTAPPSVVALIDGVSGDDTWEAPGNSGSELIGSALVVIGDLDGDDVPDVIASGDNVSRAISGADGSRIHDLASSGSSSTDAIAVLGDVSKEPDGVPDFLVGSQRFSGEIGLEFPTNAGLVRVIDGRTGAIIKGFAGKKTNALFGLSVAALPDIDRDEVSDYAFTASITKGSTFNPGILVYSGRKGRKIATIPTAVVPDATIVTLQTASPGDVDRDGISDLLVRVKTAESEYVGILSGAPVDDPLLFRYDRPEGEFFGGVGIAGDVSDPPDGVPDLIVSLTQSNVVRVVEVKALPRIPSKVANARAFVRPGDTEESLSARLSLVVKKGVQTFSIVTDGFVGAKPGDGVKAATGPFGVLLEDGVGADTFTSIGQLDSSGSYIVSATGAVPPQLGVQTLADVVGRRVQLRDEADATLLETVAPDLLQAKKEKTNGTLQNVSDLFPKAKLKLKAAFNPKTGAVDVKARVKNAGDGPFTFELETGKDSGAFEVVAQIESGKLKLSTGTGAPLAGAFDVDDLRGRFLRVYSGEELVFEGAL